MDIIEKKFIVFGANGYLGRHLVQMLNANGADVLASDIHGSSRDPNIRYVKIDTTVPADFVKVSWNVDYVFVFAGITGTQLSFDNYERFIAINETGLVNILTSVRNSKFRPRIIFPSSRLVYKGSEFPLKESDVKEAKTVYAVNKLAGELFLNVFASSFGINHTIYRICVPYGNIFDNDYSYGTIGLFFNQAINQSKISLFGDGSLRRTFTHIEDICHQIIHSCVSPKSVNETFNIIGQDYSLLEIATLIATRFNAEICHMDWPDQEHRIESGSTILDGTKLKNMFNFNLQHDVSGWLSNLPTGY